MTTREQLAVPTVHRQGTSREMLLNDLAVAIAALQVAGHRLVDTAPHARDYYLQGDGAYVTALDQFESRRDRINDVRDELVALYEAIEKL